MSKSKYILILFAFTLVLGSCNVKKKKCNCPTWKAPPQTELETNL